ncbi:hypothetical protein U6A24_06415 [Aquimarina gracilis]|uniref:Activator of Hsp90 ATPase-like protein n=1 Tax=Aquimarina gracilis TaxID=874422 RepID=A0ABU5ZSU5_9FLAO|nr:hypothetical protein [Aquimarina gracilis]MEB3345085.1 hypothetical protein [Aquimarina gracilis]
MSDNIIEWNLHLNSSIQKVYKYLSTQDGREKFWAESAPDSNNYIDFTFPNGQQYKGKIIVNNPYTHFRIEYFNSIVDFYLTEDELGGTDLKIRNTKVSEKDYQTNYAGWVSLLLILKAAIDYNIDLRNHNRNKTWDHKYVDN